MQPLQSNIQPPLQSQSSLQPLQERVKVIKTEGEFAWVSVVDSFSGCDSCASKGACGSFNLFKPMLDSKLNAKTSNNDNRNNLKVRNTLHVATGDEVIIEISSQSLLSGTFLVYLLPLFTLFIAAVLGKQIIGSELASAIAGIIGLMLGLFFVKLILSKTTFKERFEPMMVRA